MIENKNELIYSLNQSILDLKSVIDTSISTNTENSKEVYYKLGSTLLWIGSCLDRLKKCNQKFSPEENKYVKAFMGAYIAQKHSIKLFKFDDFIYGNILDAPLPCILGPGDYFWVSLEEDVIDWSKLIKVYNKVLKGKSILPEIEKIEDIIIQYINNY